MSLNWKEIDLILSELPLEGSHIQGILQPDFRSLILELYTPGEAWTLLINLSSDACRLHRLSFKQGKPKVTQRFSEFLRSRIRGGRIVSADQPTGDRIVRLLVRRGEETTVLWLRLWGAASNIIVSEEDGTVLDAFFRRPNKGEVTGGFFMPGPHAGPAEGLGPPEVPGPAKTFEVRPHPQKESFNVFIDGEYRRREEENLKKRLWEQLETRRKTREAKLHSVLGGLHKRREDYLNLELFRKYGDLVMANLHTVKKGDGWLSARDYGNDGGEIEIELDPKISPHENAEVFYRKYKKAKSGLDVLEEEIHNLESTLRHMEERRQKLSQETDIAVLEEELRRDRPAKIKEKEKSSSPGLRFFSAGFTILVGRTAAENDELLRRHVRGNDFWLHTRDCPGGYIFIKTRPGKSVPLDTLLDAGNLAVFYSKARNSGAAELYYTQVKHLRRAKGGKLGTVLPTHEKNLSVKIEPARLERLDGKV